MGELFDIDAALKRTFALGPTSVMNHITGGAAVREILNVELPAVLKRRVDLLAAVEDGSVLHVEFQCRNDPRMGKRMAVYHAVLAERYGEVRSVVLYFGRGPMRMPTGLTTGQMKFEFALIDIRAFGVDELLWTRNPSDCVLALLAAQSKSEFKRVLASADSLPTSQRWETLALLVVLSALRKLPRSVRLELNRMDTRIRLRDDSILMQFRREAVAEGRREGRLEGLRDALRDAMGAKFGRVPAWASARIRAANRVQLRRWIKRSLTGETLERVLGPRR